MSENRRKEVVREEKRRQGCYLRSLEMMDCVSILLRPSIR